jgi:hypothetical protein
VNGYVEAQGGNAMRNRLIAVGLIIAAVLLIRRLVLRGGVDWETRIDRMPDTSPPKWMFNNIRTIRENTDRILERLEDSKAVDVP